jgi:hypothetical protein
MTWHLHGPGLVIIEFKLPGISDVLAVGTVIAIGDRHFAVQCSVPDDL